MGRKGSWFSAIKRVFTHRSKDRAVNGPEKKSGKEKKGSVGGGGGGGILSDGDRTKSLLPTLFRKPSSIEKILQEADQQKLFLLRSPPPPTDGHHPTPGPSSSPRIRSPRALSPRSASPKAVSSRPSSPRVSSPKNTSARSSTRTFVPQRGEASHRPEPTLRYRHLSATKIQAAYRGYMARRSFRALRGLVRLQGVLRGQNVKRQTMNAMRQMQLLVRVQTQIQSRRIKILESQVLQQQAYIVDKEAESTLGKWTLNQISEAREHEDWDNSVVTKEEREAGMRRKVEAIVKRERAMAYAYSHKLLKPNSKSAQAPTMEIRSGGFPWWWNWVERQQPSTTIPSDGQHTNNFTLTPSRSTPDHKPTARPQSSNSKNREKGFFVSAHLESHTPRSSKTASPSRSKQFLPQVRSPNVTKNAKSRAGGADSTFDVPLKDDDSLMSCPPFSVPNYMAPTASTNAKARASSSPRDRFPGTPVSDSKRRFSFPLTPNIGSFKWGNKGTSGKDSSSSKRPVGKHHSPRSIGDFSVDSAISMPVTIGRKPFNRFV